MSKRAFDIFFSAGALLVLTPLLLAVALWVRLDSAGPVFFRQRRVGMLGREFLIFKFRTMRIEAQAQGLQLTVGDDARITRSGAFLRKYKIDEFPQFINVLLGDMSVVGPRPEVPRYVAHYPPALRDAVLAVRPGITDPSSLEFLDEASLLAAAADPEREYIERILPIKLQRAADYARQASLGSDLRVVWRTLRRLVAQR